MHKSKTLSHLERLDKLESMLKSDDLHTIPEIAGALGVSKRTLQRDINILRERGLPIDADRGRGGGIRLHRSWGIGRISLSNIEAIELLMSIAITEKMNSPLFKGNLSSIRYKISALLSQDQKRNIEQVRNRILIGSSASPTVLHSYELSLNKDASDLNVAFLYKKHTKIRYCDEKQQETTRVIEPHYLYLNYPVWYVFAWDLLREDFRVFRCDRIETCWVLETSFSIRPFDDFAQLLRSDQPNSI